jgi:hypothetical protein
MKKYRNGGYAGILALLLGTVIMFLILWKFNPFTANNNGVQNSAEQDIQAVQRAKILKDKLEQRDNQMMSE